MSQALPMVYLVRHADTAWTLTGQHTGRTDIHAWNGRVTAAASAR
jgi:broad specificity phosphatase PhoE